MLNLKLFRDVPILYHGTNRCYFENQLSQSGRYEHNNRKHIELTGNIEDALDYAFRRSIRRNTEGTLLMIDTIKILLRLKIVFWRRPVIKYLNPDEFTIYHLPKRTNKEITIDDIANITQVCQDNFGISPELSPLIY
ncbi:MAG: hypothetical protein ABIG89_07485 [Candidatus Woesearchaeota archaeon]